MRRLKLLLFSVPVVLVFSVAAQCANLKNAASATSVGTHGSALRGSRPTPAAPAQSAATPAAPASPDVHSGTVLSALEPAGGRGDATGAAGPEVDEAAPTVAARNGTRTTAEIGNRHTAEPAGPTSGVAAEASALYDLKFEATQKVDKGGKGAVRARIVPRAGAHLSDDAPVTLTLLAPPSLVLSKTRATKADVKYAGGGGSLELPFEAVESGKAVIEARLKFYICTDKTCAQQERTATLPVTVR